MSYALRSIDRELDFLMRHAPAVALDGPKGVGKTATASRRADYTWNVERSQDREHLIADYEFRNTPAGTLFIDEWQHLPDSWNAVRRSVDTGAPPGRFLLAGSATPRPGATTHSGAMRILSLRMRPMGMHERFPEEAAVSLGAMLAGESPEIAGTTEFKVGDYYEAITASGFPATPGMPARVRNQYLDAYLQRVIDKDLPDQGYRVRRPDTLRRWLTAYGRASSTVASQNKILDAATLGGERPAKTTATSYRDFLTQLWLLDPTPAWSPALESLRQLQQAEKHQLADPALAARLLNLSARTLGTPAGADMAGPLFESLASLTVRAIAQSEGARMGHLRTNGGREEVDLIVEGDEGQIVAIEVKLSPEIEDHDVKHLKWLRRALPDNVVDLVVITTGQRAYRRSDGIAVVPLVLLGH